MGNDSAIKSQFELLSKFYFTKENALLSRAPITIISRDETRPRSLIAKQHVDCDQEKTVNVIAKTTFFSSDANDDQKESFLTGIELKIL